MNSFLKLLVVVAAMALATGSASAADWTDCADAYEDAPMFNWQSCYIVRQNVPDLNIHVKDGPLGYRYRKGKSKWCRIRAECPKTVEDCSSGKRCDPSGCRCPVKAVMVKTTASIKLKHADETRWCARTADGKAWYLARSCDYSPSETHQ